MRKNPTLLRRQYNRIWSKVWRKTHCVENETGAGVQEQVHMNVTRKTIWRAQFGEKQRKRFLVAGSRSTSNASEVTQFGACRHSMVTVPRPNSQISERCRTPRQVTVSLFHLLGGVAVVVCSCLYYCLQLQFFYLNILNLQKSGA